jgi:hypothetical protein
VDRVTPVERVREALTAANCRTRDGRNWTCPVPTHEDTRPSLSVTEGRDGRALLNCHRECSFEAIVAAIGLQPADLYPSRQGDEWTPWGVPMATYRYVDKAGKLVMGVDRFPGKQFRQWRPDESKRGGKAWKLDDATKRRLVPYRLPEILAAADDGRPVFVVEGEKDADAIVAAGAAATCNVMGAGKWRDTYAKWFEGADVIVVADRDDPGRAHAVQVARSLAGVAAAVRIVEPAVDRPHADASDHLAAGKTLDELVAPAWVEGLLTGTDITEGDLTGDGIIEGMLAAGPPVLPVALEAGADLLADVDQFLERYVYFSTGGQAVAVTLFAAHTWAFEAAEATPYLHVNSAEAESGKTLLLDLLELICRRPLMAANTTVAALFRSITDPAPTVLFDEVQEVFGRGGDDAQRERRQRASLCRRAADADQLPRLLPQSACRDGEASRHARYPVGPYPT